MSKQGQKYLTDLSDDEIREQLYNMTIKEILDARLYSKRWDKIISDDKFWCKLLNMRYKIKKSKDCLETLQNRKSWGIILFLDDYKQFYRDVEEAINTFENIIQSIIKYEGSNSLGYMYYIALVNVKNDTIDSEYPMVTIDDGEFIYNEENIKKAKNMDKNADFYFI